jgi:hypothetical protein
MDDAVSELDQGDPADVDAGVGKPHHRDFLERTVRSPDGRVRVASEYATAFRLAKLFKRSISGWTMQSRNSIKAIRRTSMRVSANP